MTPSGAFPVLYRDFDSEGGNDPPTCLSPRSLPIKVMRLQGSLQSGSWPCLGEINSARPPLEASEPPSDYPSRRWGEEGIGRGLGRGWESWKE